MRAFSENLSIKFKYIDVIRVGETAGVDGDDWEYAVNCCANDRANCVLIALASDGKFTEAHKDSIIEQAFDLGYSTIKWRRKRKNGQGFREVTVRCASDSLRHSTT